MLGTDTRMLDHPILTPANRYVLLFIISRSYTTRLQHRSIHAKLKLDMYRLSTLFTNDMWDILKGENVAFSSHETTIKKIPYFFEILSRTDAEKRCHCFSDFLFTQCFLYLKLTISRQLLTCTINTTNLLTHVHTHIFPCTSRNTNIYTSGLKFGSDILLHPLLVVEHDNKEYIYKTYWQRPVFFSPLFLWRLPIPQHSVTSSQRL